MAQDLLTLIGEQFGNSISELVSNALPRSVEVVSRDDNNAYVRIYEEDEPLPVPLSYLMIEGATLKVLPTIESTATIIFLNGDQNRPQFIQYSQIDGFSFVRSDSEFTFSVDPEDSTKDNLNVRIGESYINVASNTITFNGGGNEGLVLANPLRDSLLKINNLLDAITNVLSGSQIPEPGNGAPSALQTALSGAITGKSLDTYDNIKNENILQ